ncbi:MAG: hypothetical protein KGK01_02020 [Bradyrhizobium sp.]|uniref:hypothetical protein n=1 Tax=Bradyrhizobium sp. TaxID=376 RepID=UPI001C29ECB2|nr:hypothetical protein [Bradyrhizobium sp.]MBU6463584.1 hypothetical protein [Pseudomonadota bacterium]MDE2067030.1 hypothetical protein [Bradyrhizobium sp.]MDE2241240.1 hypothetical protein [Bradyrhizobium sp.]MDE2470763.1 hypothetical protein [Bradyrhizobium sp.]
MNTQTGFLDNLVSAIRENPLAATLIGGGALWLVAGNEKLKDAASSATTALVDGARNVRTAVSELQRTTAPPTAPEMDHDGAFHAGESLHQAAGAAADVASGTTDKVKDRLNEGTAYAREKIGNLGNAFPGKEALTRAQSSLANIFESQPLALGMIGMAIGAAVAGAFRTSDLENEWLGDTSDDAKANLGAKASAASQSIREASDTLNAELSDMGAEAADRLKHAGTDAANAALDKVKS